MLLHSTHVINTERNITDPRLFVLTNQLILHLIFKLHPSLLFTPVIYLCFTLHNTIRLQNKRNVYKNESVMLHAEIVNLKQRRIHSIRIFQNGHLEMDGKSSNLIYMWSTRTYLILISGHWNGTGEWVLTAHTR